MTSLPAKASMVNDREMVAGNSEQVESGRALTEIVVLADEI